MTSYSSQLKYVTKVFSMAFAYPVGAKLYQKKTTIHESMINIDMTVKIAQM
jgi:hypothetical protein